MMHSSDLGKRYSTQGLPVDHTLTCFRGRVDCLALRLQYTGRSPGGSLWPGPRATDAGAHRGLELKVFTSTFSILCSSKRTSCRGADVPWWTVRSVLRTGGGWTCRARWRSLASLLDSLLMVTLKLIHLHCPGQSYQQLLLENCSSLFEVK